MANEDLVFTAVLNHRPVVRSLEEIGTAAAQAAASGDTALARIAQGAAAAADGYERIVKSVSNEILVMEQAGAVGTKEMNEAIKRRDYYIGKIEETKKNLLEEIALIEKRKNVAINQQEGMIEGPGNQAFSIAKGQAQFTGFEMEDFVELGGAEANMKRLGDIIVEMMSRGELSARQFGAVFHTIATNLAGELKGDSLANALKPIEAQAKNILNMFKSGDFDIAKDANADTLLAQMTELKAVASQFLQSSNEDANKFGATLLARLDQVEDKYINSGKSLEGLRSGMSAVNGELRQGVKSSTDLKQEFNAMGKLPLDLQKKINAKKVETDIKALENVIKKLGQSTSIEAKEAGEAFDSMGKEIIDAYKASDIGAEDTIKGLRDVASAARKTGNTFDENFNKLGSAADAAGPPIWKIGTAMDRIGFRGAGGILRVVDAVKQLGPAFIVAAVAAAGVAIAITKLIGLAVELGKKLSQAFLEFTKESVAAAVAIENLDSQFAGLLGGRPDLGKKLREIVLDYSFDFGVDLTGDFANILVPLAEDTDQIRQMAEDVAAIAHLRGIAVENIVNAVKQATGGHFRPFQQTLGMTPQEVNRIKDLQQAYGELTGTLMGLEEFMERRGINFEALGDSLVVAKGKLVVFRKEVAIAFGEPIKNSLGEVLSDFIDDIENRRSTVLSFFENIGKIIGDIVEKIGDLAQKWTDSIDYQDIRDVENAIKGLGEAVEYFIDTLGEITDNDIEGIKDAAIALVDVIGNLIIKVADLVEQLDDLNDFLNFDLSFGSGAEEELTSLKSYIKEITKDPITFGVRFAIIKPLKDIAAELADSFLPDEKALYDKLQEKFEGQDIQNIFRVVDIIDQRRDDNVLGDAGERIAKAMGFSIADYREFGEDAGAAFTGGINAARDEGFRFAQGGWQAPRVPTEEEINTKLTLSQNEIREGELQDQIDELQDKIKPLNIGIEFDQKQAAIYVDEADKLLQKEIDFSIKRRDATIKYLNQQRDAKIKYNIDVENEEQSAQYKILDLWQEFRDKEEDINEDAAKERIKLEEKLQEKLRDIKAKFDFDAAEAIRMNDAVSLLRIRRRMEFELSQAKLKHQEEVEDNEDKQEEKRKDNLKWLWREVRDADTAEQRKLQELLKSYEEKKNAMDQQYSDELAALALHEQDKEAEILQWRKDALRDLDTWHDDKLAMMANQYDEEIALIRQYEAEIRRMRQQSLMLMGGGFGAMGISPTGGFQGSNWPAEYTGYRPGQGQPITNYGGITTPSPTQTPTQSTIPFTGITPQQPTQPPNPYWQATSQTNYDQELEGLRKEAVRLANKGGFFPLANSLAKMASKETIRQTIYWLRQQGLAMGGIAPAGRPTLVGERGPEPIIPMSAGIVAPHAPLNFSPGVSNGGQTINDNSQNVNADLSLLDPSQVSPMQRTIIRSIIAEEILSFGVN